MVKGISRQVIVVHPPDSGLFDQVIFILGEQGPGKTGVTDSELMREARRLLHRTYSGSRRPERLGLLLLAAGMLGFLAGIAICFACRYAAIMV